MSIKYLDLFSGIGGFRSGLEKVGDFECVGSCEIDDTAEKAYKVMYKTEGELFFKDVKEIQPDMLPDVDLICGGFPCQTFSIAGKRRGFEDTRGTLFFEIARIAAVKKPALLFLENVPGLLSHNEGRTFATVLATLHGIGYDVWWQTLNTANFGVPQRRKRLFIIGYYRGKSVSTVFAFTQANPKSLERRIPGHEGNRVYSIDGLGITLTSSAGGFGGKTGLYLVPIPIKSKTKSGYQIALPNDSIDTAYSNLNSRRGRVGPRVAHTQTTSDTQAIYGIDMNPNPKITELARCITARQDAGISHRKGEHSGIMVIVKEITPQELLELSDESKNRWIVESDFKRKVACLIISDCEGRVFVGYIRKLTPRECWRLQGFTDEQFNKVVNIGIKNSGLYKLAGNAVSVPVISAVGEQLKIIFYGGDQ